MTDTVKHFDTADAAARLSAAIQVSLGHCPEDPKQVQKLHDFIEKRFNALIIEVEQFYR